jgi:hypothetical protein
MPADRFWQIIGHAARFDHDPDAHLEALSTALRGLTLEDIVSFEVTFRKYLNEAYTWDLWGAANVIHGGLCSGDGFEYFRRWLVTRGRTVYERALADPDSLTQLDARPGPWGVWEFEGIYYVAGDVFEEKGGSGDVRDYSERPVLAEIAHPASPLRTTRRILPGVTPSSGSDSGQHHSA